jgi:predicted DNA-binding protein with PD1-like motif
MVSFEAHQPTRTIVIGLKRGDDLLASINAAIEKYGINQGVIVSGIAALQKAAFHRVLNFGIEGDFEIVTVEAPIELGSLQGLISEGKPHIHMTFSDEKGNTFAGHLEPGSEVLYIGEIVILVFDGGDFGRRADEFGLNLLTNIK